MQNTSRSVFRQYKKKQFARISFFLKLKIYFIKK